MAEISGFGGSYEAACRRMVLAGLEWWDAHPDANATYATIDGVYGVVGEESEDCHALIHHMVAAAEEGAGEDGGGVTGAMVQATLSHVGYAHKHGWEAYVAEMSKPEEDNDDGDQEHHQG
jgi:hypothetical protein